MKVFVFLPGIETLQLASLFPICMSISEKALGTRFPHRYNQFKRMNAVYASVFKTPRPARVTVGVAALAVLTAHVEIMVTAQPQASKN